MAFDKLQAFTGLAKKRGTKRLVITSAEDGHALSAIREAFEAGIIEPTFTGDKEKIIQLADKNGFDINAFQIYHNPIPGEAASTAVRLIYEGKADIIMKGLVSSRIFLKALLNRNHGLKKAPLISHIAFFESRAYRKILCITDAAINISPTLDEKINIINNAVEIYHKLGISNPKIAIIAAVEKVNSAMEATVHAALIRVMNIRGQIKNCTIDGPLALDNAISKDAARMKNIGGEVAGNADILLMPDINCGNIFYKSLNFMGGATSAAIVTGARVPVVLTSRADNHRSKYNSIALAAAVS